MKKILSIVLSFTLLFNTLVPAFAQRGPLRIVTRTGGNQGELEKMICRRALGAQLEKDLVEYRNTLSSLSQQGTRIVEDFSLGKYETLGKDILDMPTPDKTLLQNEMVGLFLLGELPPFQRGQAVSYLEESLAEAKEIFGAVSVPEKYLITEEELRDLSIESGTAEYFSLIAERLVDVDSWAQQDPAVHAALDLLADAAALGMMGRKQDIPSLMELYEASIGTPFEPMAGNIVLGSMLRLELHQKMYSFLDNPNYPARDYVDNFMRKLPAELVDSLPALHSTQGSSRVSKFYQQLDYRSGKYLEHVLRDALQQKGPFAKAGGQGDPNIWLTIGCGELGDIKTLAEKGRNRSSLAPVQLKQLQPGVSPHTASVLTGPSIDSQDPYLGLSTVVPVLESSSAVPADDAEDYAQLLSSRPTTSISVQGTGFKFALEDEVGGEKIIPNVNITISEGIKASRFSRVAINKDGIIELRGDGEKNTAMSRFYFQLSPENGALNTLVKGIAGFPHKTLYVKLFSNKKKSIKQEISQVWNKLVRGRATLSSIPLYDSSKGNFVIALTDVSLLPKECVDRGLDGILIVKGDQVFYEDREGSYLLKDFYVRLPKEFRDVWSAIMQKNQQQDFSLTIFPTYDKTFVMTNIVPLLQVGTGKAFGPIMHSLGLPHWLADGIPMFANNGMPVVLAPLMRFLRRFGDANIYRAGIGVYALSSWAATLGLGLNGFGGLENFTAVQVGGLITILLGMGAANVLTRTNQNNLMLQNLGRVIPPKEKRVKRVGDATQKPTIGFLAHRLKEVFTGKSIRKRASVLFQKASAFKNVGSWIFLTLPCLFNLAAMALGSSVITDFSLSFWWLGAVSLYALYHTLRLPLKDTFIRNPETLERMLKDKEYELLPFIEAELDKPQGEQDFAGIAQELHGIISPLAQTMSFRTESTEEGLCEGLEWASISRLVDLLREDGISLQQGVQFTTALKEQFDSLSRRNIRYKDIFKIPGMKSALTGMTLLTSHELGASLSFSYAVNQALEKTGITGSSNISFGAAISAFFLYGTAFLSRLLGNRLAVRVRDGTMYAFSSLCSVVGTALMIGANDSFAPLLTGAILAGFGMGNFFAQVFEHTVGLDKEKKYAAEIAQIITLTMPIAALLASQLPTLADTVGMTGLDLKLAGGLLLGGLWATRKMFSDSSLVDSMRYYWEKIKNKFHKDEPPAEESSSVEEGPSKFPAKYKIPVHG